MKLKKTVGFKCLFFQIDKENNTALNLLLEGVQKVNTSRTLSNVTGFQLNTFLPQTGFSYFLYPGSITVPPCTETVTWIVIDQPMNISELQMKVFRNVMGNDNETIITNARLIKRMLGYGR